MVNSKIATIMTKDDKKNNDRGINSRGIIADFAKVSNILKRTFFILRLTLVLAASNTIKQSDELSSRHDLLAKMFLDDRAEILLHTFTSEWKITHYNGNKS